MFIRHEYASIKNGWLALTACRTWGIPVFAENATRGQALQV